MTSASSAARASPTNPAALAATTSLQTPPAPSPPSSPSATTSSAPSSLACAAPAWAASPHTGPASTPPTRARAPACRNSSTTSASPRPPHRQHFFDHEKANGLDADLAAAFDRIGHSFLLSQLGTFPARELIAGWLTAGVAEDGRFTPTGEGTPQ